MLNKVLFRLLLGVFDQIRKPIWKLNIVDLFEETHFEKGYFEIDVSRGQIYFVSKKEFQFFYAFLRDQHYKLIIQVNVHFGWATIFEEKSWIYFLLLTFRMSFQHLIMFVVKIVRFKMYLFPIDFIIDSKQTCKCHDIKNRNALGQLIESRCIDHANIRRLVVFQAPYLVNFVSVLF